MNKKVGLVSIPCYYNFGTQLQLYALQTSIEELGYSCEVINYVKDYRPPPQHFSRRLSNVVKNPHRLILGSADRFYRHYQREKNKHNLELSKQFERERLHLSRIKYTRIEELEESPPRCEAFVVGSDQVWHPGGHLGEDAFFLTFTDSSRRIAYSPSLGVSKIPPESVSWIKQGLQGMRFLSVRESTGAKLIQDVSGRTAEVVVDPTLLISSDHWRAMANRIETPKKYVLLYALCGDSYIRRFCRKIANKLNCSIVVLPKHARDVLWFSGRVVRAFDIGPAEFLSLFSNAEFVVTDSFHGTVFSIQFQKPFYTFRRYDDPAQSATFSRITDLLEKLGLEQRIASKTSLPDQPFTPVNYKEAMPRLRQWVEQSRQYLSASLEAATSRDNQAT